MEIHYPNGKRFQQFNHKVQKPFLIVNRGMALEEDINESNDYYLSNQIAVIHKKPSIVSKMEENEMFI
ncbi:Holliday junction resolvase RecU [Bacillus kwashiorkori]|uniref:Holliday junction resolvase RecU n=1 Tax=Bacillus kwashiorkori TaxID=1522318 RepID=UPI0007853304|nr:Holliday junction resolvase RecU [Bacillus kwashiorkori]